jgi:hypothetical protein
MTEVKGRESRRKAQLSPVTIGMNCTVEKWLSSSEYLCCTEAQQAEGSSTYKSPIEVTNMKS